MQFKLRKNIVVIASLFLSNNGHQYQQTLLTLDMSFINLNVLQTKQISLLDWQDQDTNQAVLLN